MRGPAVRSWSIIMAAIIALSAAGSAMAGTEEAAGGASTPPPAAQAAGKTSDEGTGGDTVTIQAGAGEDGFYLRSTDGSFLIKLKALLQLDGRFYADDTAPDNVDTFLLRRARPILEGTVYQKFDFRFVPDFGQGRTVIQDAYVDARFLPEFKVRAGKFKSPFGLERLQPDAAAPLAERSLASNLAPDRDIGLMVHGELAHATLTYSAAVLNGVADGASGDTDINDAKDAVARLFWIPWKASGTKALKGLGFGLGATWGSNVGTSLTPGLNSYRTFGQQAFFAFIGDGRVGTTVVADGHRERLAPQAYYYVGRLGLLTEYVSSRQEVTLGSASESLTNKAWSLGASFLFTDDEASYGGVAPKRAFGKGGAGALEVVARYGKLTIDDAAFPVFADPAKSASEAVEWELGVNWYLNRSVRFLLDGGLTTFKGGAPNGGDREDEKVLISRVQLVF